MKILNLGKILYFFRTFLIKILHIYPWATEEFLLLDKTCQQRITNAAISIGRIHPLNLF